MLNNNSMPRKMARIAVIHDHLGWSGGGERTALTMALALDADFITIHASPNTFPEYQRELGDRLKILSNRPLDKEIIRFFWQRFILWKNRKILANYDIVIASGIAVVGGVSMFSRKEAKKILYCHTPPRRIYDLYEISHAGYKWFLRPLFTLFAKYWDLTYRSALKNYDHIIANSQNVKDRLEKYTGFKADEVIWPPISTDKFSWLSQGDYFLSWGRLDEAKRIELIVAAFQKMPDKKLVVASGGPRYEKILAKAEGYDNIQVLGWIDDSTLFDLVGNCLAAIYIPIDEDAGMTHLEANAAGKFVIGVDDGGLKETIIEGETGFKLRKEIAVEDIINAVNKTTPKFCLSKKDICVVEALKYNKSIFEKRIKGMVETISTNIDL